MNRDQFEGAWRQFRGAIQKQWGKLTNDDMDQIQGNWDELVGRIQRQYGITREEAESRIQQWNIS